MALSSTQLQLPVYDFGSSSGSEFGTVTLRAADLPTVALRDELVDLVRTFLEGLPGVNSVLVELTDVVKTVV